MPPQSTTGQQPQDQNGALLIILIIALIAAIAIGTGYFLYTNNRPTPTSQSYPEQPAPSNPEPVVNEPTLPDEILPTPSPTPAQPTTSPSYSDWKTYVYRAPGGGGFSIKYPPGFAVGQERTKDETYFTLFPSPNPLNKPEVMEIYYEGNGNVRFVQPTDSGDWPYYDQVVQSFQKIK